MDWVPAVSDPQVNRRSLVISRYNCLRTFRSSLDRLMSISRCMVFFRSLVLLFVTSQCGLSGIHNIINTEVNRFQWL